MYVGCAQKNIVAPPIKQIYVGAKVVFNILIFFSETTSRLHLILCHYIPGCWTIIVCSSQLETPPTGFLAELSKLSNSGKKFKILSDLE